MATLRLSIPPLIAAALVSAVFTTTTAHAQATAQPLSVSSLLSMNEAQLQAVYTQGSVAGLPTGKVKGTVLPAPGSRRNAAMSAGGRLIWQGKVVDSSGTIAVNRFFGVPAVKGRLYQGTSWFDGQPSLILDYTGTSRVYAQNRDEIRLIGPGLYLGLMHERTTPQPTLKTYFVLETQP
ncbi:hypothetical protein [Paludisphaera rhizosphaerae]|uniref:hypothetical protein n=1 Tax=Paludisphaera rhizosphaerae TaxID=2711216 RepID=UPI0013EAFF32|nr:hypothetical protein [Paludisphaera rhizosphaerae]